MLNSVQHVEDFTVFLLRVLESRGLSENDNVILESKADRNAQKKKKRRRETKTHQGPTKRPNTLLGTVLIHHCVRRREQETQVTTTLLEPGAPSERGGSGGRRRLRGGGKLRHSGAKMAIPAAGNSLFDPQDHEAAACDLHVT